jgi:hypothetical protein
MTASTTPTLATLALPIRLRTQHTSRPLGVKHARTELPQSPVPLVSLSATELNATARRVSAAPTQIEGPVDLSWATDDRHVNVVGRQSLNGRRRAWLYLVTAISHSPPML